MRSIYLFLFLFLCSACSDFDNKEVLDRELSDVSILSVSFDSLLSEVRKMPSRDRVACIINVSRRNEKEIDGVKKQERLLMEILPISYGKKRKEVLLHLVTICSNLDRFGIPCAELRGLKWIELLEKNHSLSQEEEWQVSEIKALLLNRSGNQDEFLPIWYKLLKQYREADRPEDVGKCLLTIANHFVMLEDYDNALPLYEEAYQLAVEYEFVDLQKSSGIMLIKHLCGAGYYSRSLEYYNKTNQEITFNPAMQNEVVKSYMELNKPDSARIYLAKRLLLEGGNKIALNCIIRKSKFPQNPKRSVRFSGKRTKRSVQKRKARNTQKAETKVL